MYFHHPTRYLLLLPLVLTLSLFSPLSQANQLLSLETKQLATVRVITQDSASTTVSPNVTATTWGYGSGIIVNYDSSTQLATILTCAHLFRENPVAIYVWPPNHPKPSLAKLVKSGNPDAPNAEDLAILQARILPSSPVRAVQIDFDFKPVPSRMVEIRGYGDSTVQQIYRGVITNKKYISGSIEVTTPVNQGDSGGPVFNTQGLVGIVWGTDHAGAFFTPVSKIKEFLETQCPPGSSYCPSGSCPPTIGRRYYVPTTPRVVPYRSNSPQSNSVRTTVSPHSSTPTVVQGPPGPQGPSGATGPIGPSGPAGLPGKDASNSFNVSELELKIQKNTASIDSLQKEVGQLAKNQDTLTSGLRELTLQVQRNQQGFSSSSKSVDSLTKSLNEAVASIRDLENDNRNLHIQLERLTKEFATQESSITQLRSGKIRFRLIIDDSGKVTGVEPVETN